ncbi:MAG: type II toxin-antitoxin system RelE/ParE family toxin [Spirochaetaceae bacterium]
MPKLKIEFLAPAIRDIEKVAEFHLRMVGPKSAELITDNLLETIQILENQPYAGTKHSDLLLQKQDYRKLVCNDYICIYKVIDQTIFIYRIVHGATDYPKSFN